MASVVEESRRERERRNTDRESPASTRSSTYASAGLFNSLPNELLDRILSLSDPESLSAFSQTTSSLHSYVEDNLYLWRTLYLRYYDDPPKGTETVIDWKGDVQRRTLALHIVNATITQPPEDIENATEILIDVAQSACLGPTNSRSIEWIDENIPLYFIELDSCNKGLTQSRAKLEVLRCEYLDREEDRLASQSYVYDMRNYKITTRYGPFLPQRSSSPLEINYVHLHHLMNVLFNNIYHFHIDQPNSPIWMSRGFCATRSMTAPPSPVEGDWAGIEGEWIKFVCWMDYGDLEEYNWSDGTVPPKNAVLDNSIFQQLAFMEAHAFLQVSLRVTSIDPQSPNSDRRPTIYFEGSTIGGEQNESMVKGRVTDEGGGVIRWHHDSIAGNATRWQTEGTQIGGAQSAAGWIGCWTSPDHVTWDPAGPNWSYKIG